MQTKLAMFEYLKDKTLVSTDKSYNFVGILQKKKMF
jgi:hypothetical protein